MPFPPFAVSLGGELLNLRNFPVVGSANNILLRVIPFLRELKSCARAYIIVNMYDGNYYNSVYIKRDLISPLNFLASHSNRSATTGKPEISAI